MHQKPWIHEIVHHRQQCLSYIYQLQIHKIVDNEIVEKDTYLYRAM